LELPSTYRTLAAPSEGIYKEKGSKFIGYAIACYSEAEAKVYLRSWRKQNHQARHLCYAYRFGVEQNNYRSNDDGEPNNSAGAPILGQIQSFDLSNVLIGVVRYFGGTKLGVGGLIHAYRTAAKEAIESGEILEKEVFERIELQFNYTDMPWIMNYIKQCDLTLLKQNFELICTLQLALPLNKKEVIKKELLDLPSVELTIVGIY
jgi:uncharacterized YigZ family protein